MSSTMTIEAVELQPIPSLAAASKPSTPKPTSIINSDNANTINSPDNTISTTHPQPPPISTLRLTLTILQTSAVNFFGSFSSGILTIGLPLIADSLSLPRSLLLWPQSVYYLTSGASLLLAGSATDILGPRHVEVAAMFLLGACVLACGLAQTGIQLVVFRALQGVGLAMHIPASVAIVGGAVPAGRARNVGFGCLGLSQVLGFSFGTVVNGVMIERVGWRIGFYMCGGAILVAAAGSWWTLPAVKTGSGNEKLGVRGLMKKLGKEIDWVGGIIAGAGVALMSYVLAVVSADLSIIRSATIASLLALSLVLLIAFPVWMGYRERIGRPALIPNSMWKNLSFTSICALVALSFGALNSMIIFCSLYFQEIQNHSTLISSLYLLPNLIVGMIINLSMGLFIDRLPAGWLIVVSSLLCAIGPLMMALVDPAWKYYYVELWAQILTPLSANVLFTVGLIIVSDVFPPHMQALAGAVFHTVELFGVSIIVALCQVVALGVGKDLKSDGADAISEETAGDMLRGYRAGFWMMFSMMATCGIVAIVGMRGTNRVGLKKD